MPVNVQTIRAMEHFSISRTDQKKLGKDVNRACSEITAKVRTIGHGLKELAQDKHKLNATARMERNLVISAEVVASVQELSAAVDQMVIESRRLQTSKPIDQIVKFERKLETASNQMKELIEAIEAELDPGTKKQLEAALENLSAISSKCKTSENELTDIKASLETKDSQRKIPRTVKAIYAPDAGVIGKVQRLAGSLIKALPWVKDEDIRKGLKAERQSVSEERRHIEQQLPAVQHGTEINGLLSRITKARNHINQMIKITSAMLEKNKEHTQEMDYTGQLLRELKSELTLIDACEKTALDRKKLVEVRQELEDLKTVIKNLRDFDLELQLKIKQELTSLINKLYEVSDLSSENKQFQSEIGFHLEMQITHINYCLFDILEEGLTNETFLTILERFENLVQDELGKVHSKKKWDPGREQQLLTWARKEMEPLASAAEKYFPNDPSIKQKLRALQSSIDQTEEIIEIRLQARNEEIAQIHKITQENTSKMRQVMADKALDPEAKIVRLQELEAEMRASKALLNELRVSDKVPLYIAWKEAMDQTENAINHCQMFNNSLEIRFQIPAFRTTLNNVRKMQPETVHSSELTVTQKLAKLKALAVALQSVLNDCQDRSLPKTVPEYKEVQEIIQEAIQLERTVQESIKNIEVDVSGLNFISRLAVKAKRSLNLMRFFGGALNSVTILAGAWKSWDPERLKTGKHVVLQQAGAEHVQLLSSTGNIVDGHFLSAAAFMGELDKLGAERKIVQLAGKNSESFIGKEYRCLIKGEAPIPMQRIHFTEEQVKSGINEIAQQLVAPLGPDFQIQKSGGNYYIMKHEDVQKMINANKAKRTILFSYAPSTERIMGLSPTEEFPCIKFDKATSRWNEAKQLLNKMNVEYSSWTLMESNDCVYLVPKRHAWKMVLKLHNNFGQGDIALEEKPASRTWDSAKRGTVLLTNNQMNIYEQLLQETLTFALAGVDVMMYNNPGKGLSTGSPDRKNIDASIEAAYQYLKQDKGISDEEILAKGQCFGGAPTAVLGQMHPKINLMLDQNPANFHDIAIRAYKDFEQRVAYNQENRFVRWAREKLERNFIVEGIAMALLGGYDVPTSLRHNQGHKLLHINVKNWAGKGGDELVPEDHPMQMLHAMTNTEGKASLSLNPGGTHVVGWWTSHESEDAVNQFLQRTGISQPLF